MDKIGNKEVVYSKTFLFSTDDAITVDTIVAATRVKLVLKFDPDKTKSVGATWGYDAALDAVKMDFVGWQDKTGSGMLEPAKIATVNDRPVFFQVAHFKIATRDFLHLQLLWGLANG